MPYLLLAIVGFTGFAGDHVPALVELPKIKPIQEQVGDVRVKAAPHPKAAPARSRIAILELRTGSGVRLDLARRVGEALLGAVAAAGRFTEVVSPAQALRDVPLGVQERLTDCISPSCLLELGAYLQVAAVITPRLSLEPDGLRMRLNYMDLAVEARWHRELRGRADEAGLIASLPTLVAALWSGKPVKEVVGAADTAPTAARAQIGRRDLFRWGAVAVGLSGAALFGGSYLVMGSAQEEFEPATASAKDYDQLDEAQMSARLLWGSGVALLGLGAAGFSWLGQ